MRRVHDESHLRFEYLNNTGYKHMDFETHLSIMNLLNGFLFDEFVEVFLTETRQKKMYIPVGKRN